MRQYLTEVGDGQVHARQLLPHRLCQVQTERATGPDRDAQEDSCTDSKAERITHRSNISVTCHRAEHRVCSKTAERSVTCFISKNAQDAFIINI